VKTDEPDGSPARRAPRRRRRPSARQIAILAHEVASEAVVAMIVKRPLLAVSIVRDEHGHMPGCVYRSWSGAPVGWPEHRRHAVLTACALAPVVAHQIFAGRWRQGWRHSPRLRAVGRIARARTDEVEYFMVGRLNATTFMLLGHKAAIDKVAYALLVHGTVDPTFVRSAIDDVITGTAWDE
jgi:hypothetical protein